jgi:hypothetical protein
MGSPDNANIAETRKTAGNPTWLSMSQSESAGKIIEALAVALV